jgi:hypothetical protein
MSKEIPTLKIFKITENLKIKPVFNERDVAVSKNLKKDCLYYMEMYDERTEDFYDNDPN